MPSIPSSPVPGSRAAASSDGRKALITGVTGQDGSYLAELLLAKGYDVWGVVRRSSSINTQRIEQLVTGQSERSAEHFHLVSGDLNDASSLNRILKTVRPDEIYNLGAQSHVQVSFDVPEYTGEVTGIGCVRLLEAMRELDLASRFYQASSSELFGKVLETPQSETTPFYPRSPYAVAKAYAFHITRNYREAYGIFAVNGILFNHESPRRGETFVTRKITRAVGAISEGLQDSLRLGNLDASRDWGFAGDYVEAMWLMLQADEPQDYVVATGETHTVREFCEIAFDHIGMPITWRGSGLDEVGVTAEGRVVVSVDPQFFRPAEVDFLLGDASKARRELGWKPRVSFAELVQMMTEADRAAARQSVPVTSASVHEHR
ncbi:MAG TPA: GDP-mannose 4,6-dehydratase [Thermoanaerobaculia bacterium]|nr:GDP-mannose 4,6-dehydratase [Thermoanaerobaculia bacterium]